MKLKNIFAVAFAVVMMTVSTSGVLAAPNQPTDEYHPDNQQPTFSHEEQYTAAECSGCHNPQTATKNEAHENHKAMLDAGQCGSCHVATPPGTPGADVDCGSCHKTTSKASWNITYKEDNSTDTIESGKDSNGDGKPDGHHLYDLDSDGVADDQNACTDCHGNMLYAEDATQEPNIFTGKTADLGFVGDVEVFNYENDYNAKNEGLPTPPTADQMKVDPEGQKITSVNGSTFTVYNSNSGDKAGTWEYVPAPGFYGSETFMIEGSFEGSETAQFVALTVTSMDPNLDADGDGLTNGQELNGENGMGYTSDPNNADTDSDGTNDKDEIDGKTDGFCTDPKNPDTDEDGLTDTEEIQFGTCPIVSYTDETGKVIYGNDTDGDGCPDGDEVKIGTNPSDSESHPVVDNGLPSVDVEGDTDNDGLTNGEEEEIGTSPVNPDTDGDGYLDGEEMMEGTDPLNPESYPGFDIECPPVDIDFDTDNDGITNCDEILLGTSPFNPDTDGDGFNDKEDLYPLDPLNGEPSMSCECPLDENNQPPVECICSTDKEVECEADCPTNDDQLVVVEDTSTQLDTLSDTASNTTADTAAEKTSDTTLSTINPETSGAGAFIYLSATLSAAYITLKRNRQ